MGADDAFAACEVAGDAARAVVRPAHARRLCAGHFPDEPLVPGARLAALMAALAARLVEGGELVAIERCVFLRRVRPDTAIVVTARRAGPTDVEAEIASDGVPAARAVLRFGSAP